MDLYSKAEITAKSVLDVAFNVPYGEGEEHLSSRFTVRYRDDLRSIAEIMELGVGLASKALIPYSKLLASMAEVPVNSTLDILMNVVQPPIMDLNLGVVKDAFTRESYPTMNYGDRHILISGEDYDGGYITYLNFDLSNINNLEGMVIQDIHLVLQKELGTGGLMSFHECRNDWYEKYVIWNHNMQISPTPLFTVQSGQNESFIVRELTDLITQKVAVGITQFSLAIKTEDYVIFSARESGAGARIVVSYFDPEWFGYSDKLLQYNKAIIRRLEASDFKNAGLITKRLIQTGRAYVNRRENLFSKASIINTQIPSRANIVRSIYLENEGYIQHKAQLASRAFIPDSSIGGEGEVKQIRDLFSKVYINPEDGSKSLLSKAGIVKDFQESIVTLKHFKDLASKVRIGDTKLELPSKADIINVGLPNQVDVKKVKDLFSKSNILGNSPLLSTATIVKETGHNLFTKGFIRGNEDVAGAGDVQHNSDINSTSNIMNLIQLGEGTIKELVHMYAKATLVSSYYSEGKGEVKHFAQLLSQAKIRQFDQSDLISKAFIRHYVDGISGRAAITNHTFDCVAYIMQPRQWRPNYEGGLIFEDRKLPRQWDSV